MRCNRCGSNMLFEEPEEGTIEKVCLACGNRVTISVVKKESTVVPKEDFPFKPTRRIRGISAKESRRIYSKTPAGKAAWERYRRSQLFYEAHARHRQTEKYKETQKRFKEKQELFNLLLYPLPESTCPLNLFFKGPEGEIYNNRSQCDCNNGDCTFSCADI